LAIVALLRVCSNDLAKDPLGQMDGAANGACKVNFSRKSGISRQFSNPLSAVADIIVSIGWQLQRRDASLWKTVAVAFAECFREPEKRDLKMNKS
jgi:hypothetical protein